MICVGELQQLKCHNKQLLQDVVVLIAPFAPHIAEELWHQLGNEGTVCDATWPEFNEKYLIESEIQLTVSFNGKARYQKKFPADAQNDAIQKEVLEDERSQKYLEGKQVIKVIVVPKKITVHLGKPSANVRNVTVSFQSYIANVASSEVYPTWDSAPGTRRTS